MKYRERNVLLLSRNGFGVISNNGIMLYYFI